MHAHDEALEAGDVLGAYRIEGVLGEGQMGVVHRAVRDPDGTTVALKVLRPELATDDVYRRRFMREGEVASSLDHARLVPVLDYGELEGRYFMAARYVAGPSLADRLDKSPLDASELVQVVADLGSALDALHERGLVHRDVKPANVLLEDGRALLTDFGLARGEAHTVLTKQGRVVGTVDYLAPEIIQGERATPASDVYALGCLAYECAAGRAPFAERSLAEACIAHLREDPAPLDDARPDLPTALRDSVLTALAKQPGGRPRTGTAYARLLRAGAKAP
jgi:serine/threonine protein kinase